MKWAALLALTLAGCWRPDLVRVVDGIEVIGPPIGAEAYEAYARAAELEARGQDRDAAAAYEAALAIDDASAELWSRLGAVRCRLGLTAEADEAFAAAEQLDPEYGPLWRARAACALARGEPALAPAERALASDPASAESSLLYARVLAAAGRHEAAERVLHELTLREPGRDSAWEALARAADEAGHASLARAARAARARPVAREPDGVEVDRALLAGELDLALRVARRAGRSELWVIGRAILLGRPALAARQADRRLAAEPHHADARVAAALAHDLAGEPQQAIALLGALPSDSATLGAVGRGMLDELLARHSGLGREGARAAWRALLEAPQ